MRRSVTLAEKKVFNHLLNKSSIHQLFSASLPCARLGVIVLKIWLCTLPTQSECIHVINVLKCHTNDVIP